jgi:hypothetical protein
VAAKAGVTNDRWGFGVAIGDYDNDGWPDIYVSNYGKNRLYHNNHDGTFTDVAEKAGVTLGNWSTGATFGDYDGDGRLDLFVPGYVHFDIDHPPIRRARRPSVTPTARFAEPTPCADRAACKASRTISFTTTETALYRREREGGVSDKDHYYGFTGSLSTSTTTARWIWWSPTTPLPITSISTMATAPSKIQLLLRLRAEPEWRWSRQAWGSRLAIT